MDLIDRIEALFERYGHHSRSGQPVECVTPLAHALQCAQCAEAARAQPELVAAALLHDIGRFVDEAEAGRCADGHELRAASFLAAGFGRAVTEPIRLHVQAKRYLVGTDARYAAVLTPASLYTLALQGGPMGEAERRRFDEIAFARDALRLRCWDDMAKVPGRSVPPLSHYMALLRVIAEPARAPLVPDPV